MPRFPPKRVCPGTFSRSELIPLPKGRGIETRAVRPMSLFVSFDSDLLGEGDAEDDRGKERKKGRSFGRARFLDFYGWFLVGRVWCGANPWLYRQPLAGRPVLGSFFSAWARRPMKTRDAFFPSAALSSRSCREYWTASYIGLALPPAVAPWTERPPHVLL